jgi:hypothetical protein
MVDGVGGAGDGDSSSAAVPAWFSEFAAQIDRRFEGLASKLKAPSAEPGSSPAPQQQPDVGELVRSAMAYGELRSGLTDAARTRLDTLQEQGLSYAQLQLVAETLRSIRAPSTGAVTAERSAPTGLAATPAPTGAVAHPSTRSEFLRIKRENRSKYEQLMADPSFDLNKLRNA